MLRGFKTCRVWNWIYSWSHGVWRRTKWIVCHEGRGFIQPPVEYLRRSVGRSETTCLRCTFAT
jgi:hypothetical protein